MNGLPGQPPVEFEWLRVGHCRQIERLAQPGGRWMTVEFPAYCGLLRHSREGVLLFDTGYGGHYLRASRRWPYRLQASLLPVHLPAGEGLLEQLHHRGIAAEDVGRVVVSHFHADHVAGLRDLPRARVSASSAGFEEARRLRGWAAARRGLLPELLPDDLHRRFDPVTRAPREVVEGLGAVRDLLGDGSLLAIPLPGHATGHLGLLLRTTAGRQVLLIGDAAWSQRGWREARPASWLARRVEADSQLAIQTLGQIRSLAAAHPELAVLPSHCTRSAAAWRQRGHHA